MGKNTLDCGSCLKGVNVNPTNYGHCSSVLEDADHILISCDFTKITRDWITRWCSVTIGSICHHSGIV